MCLANPRFGSVAMPEFKLTTEAAWAISIGRRPNENPASASGRPTSYGHIPMHADDPRNDEYNFTQDHTPNFANDSPASCLLACDALRLTNGPSNPKLRFDRANGDGSATADSDSHRIDVPDDFMMLALDPSLPPENSSVQLGNIVTIQGTSFNAEIKAVMKANALFEDDQSTSDQLLENAPACFVDDPTARPDGMFEIVAFEWHDMSEPDITDALGFAPEVDSQSAVMAINFETAGKKYTEVARNVPPLKPPPERVRQLQGRLSAMMSGLADDEVLELVLAPVIGSLNTMLIAQALLKAFGTFGRVIHATASDLMAIEGLGSDGVVALKTVGAAALHMLRKALHEAPCIRMWDDLMKYVIARLQNERVEVFFVIFLDHNSRVIADEELSRGTINRLPGYPREVIRRCLELDAVAVILVHNHPSGVLRPSTGDVAFTQDIVKAATTMGIIVHDHIIVGRGECLSFRAQKLLS
jgi:DNA repair protein RadC